MVPLHEEYKASARKCAPPGEFVADRPANHGAGKKNRLGWGQLIPRCAPVILDSLISVFIVIALGWVLRQTLLPNDEAWKGFESISYFVLVPVLIGKTLAFAKLGEVPFGRLAITLVGTIAVIAIVLVAAKPLIERLLRTDGPGFTSIFQGVLRWNAFIALAIAANLFGTEGVTLAAVAIAALIPLLNVLSVLVLRKYGSGEGSLLRGLATNPFILGTLVGLALNVTGLPIPRSIELALDIVGRCALGAGLLLVGAGLRVQDLKPPSLAITGGVLIRLLVAPLIGFGLAKLVGMSGNAVVIAIVCLGVPTASASYLLARKMGGDAHLMAAITTGQTLVSMLTLPALLWLLT